MRHSENTRAGGVGQVSILLNFLRRGHSVANRSTPGNRFCVWLGRRLALRHKNVTLAPDALISPDAMINPRRGKITVGRACQVSPGAVLQGNIVLGDNVSVQAGSMLIGYGDLENPSGVITVGNNTRIAPKCMLIAANHVFSDPDKPICKQGMAPEPITIGDDVWIGGGVHINAGVTIGRGSVIGAGAVVTKDIPPFSVAVGVPAKVVKRREK